MFYQRNRNTEMKNNFEKAVAFVLSHEGLYSNNPADPGGETKYGISKRAHPDMDIKNLTLDEAKAIYRNGYWDDCNCDMLPYPFDVAIFDTAVNMGKTAALKIKGRSETFAEFCLFRIKYYVDLKGQVMEGWINRVIDLYKTFKEVQ